MTRGYSIKTKPFGSFEEKVEFNNSVALNARVRSQPLGVIIDDGLYDRSLKLGCVVENVVIDVKCVCDASGVIYIRDRTTTRIRRPAPELERRPDNIVSRFLQEGGSY